MNINVDTIKPIQDFINKNNQPDISKELRRQLEDYILELKNTSVPTSKLKLKNSKIKAVNLLLNISRKHILDCNDMDLIKDEVLVLKKLQHIKEASNIKEINLIMGKPEVSYYGGEIRPKHQWVLPEEEIMLWSKTSLLAPLSQSGFDRYMKLFKELFPDKYKEIMPY